MKNLSVLLTVAALMGIQYGAIAQGRTEEDMGRHREVIQDSYSRNSLSIIPVMYQDQYDSYILKAVKSLDKSDVIKKFDMNRIAENSLIVKSSREVPEDDVDKAVQSSDLPKSIISFLFMRDSDGKMSYDRISRRGHFAARDQDVLIAEKSQIGREAYLSDMGSKLIGKSYVMILSSGKPSEIKSDSKYGASYSVSINGHAYIYKLDYNDEIQSLIYDSWIQDEDSDAEIEAKKKAFDAIPFSMSKVCTVPFTVSGSSTSSFSDADLTLDLDELLRKAQKFIKDWNITTPVIQVHPVMAKIGSKEGVKNGQRFEIYKYKEDADGHLKTVKKGYARATKIINNDIEATGRSTDASKFYQISGTPLSKNDGLLIREKRDTKTGVDLRFAPVGNSLGNLGVDYLMHISTGGVCQYGMFDFGIDMYSKSKISDKARGVFDEAVMYYTFKIGYGIGVHPYRAFELRPFLLVGADYVTANSIAKAYSDDDKVFKYSLAYLGTAGLRVSYQIYYPVQIFAQCDYTGIYKPEKSIIYKAINDSLLEYSEDTVGHKNRVGLSVGLRINL